MMDQRIKEITERCEKATSGPWQYSDGVFMAHGDCATGRAVISVEYNWFNEAVGLEAKSGDVEFVCNAREDIPFLLGLINELKSSVIEDTDRNIRLAHDNIQFRAEIERLKQERDAAVSDLRATSSCHPEFDDCFHCANYTSAAQCWDKGDDFCCTHYQWRGVDGGGEGNHA